MDARRRRQVLQNDPRLQPFIISNVCPTGTQLGHGSYGVVKELEIDTFICAGKIIYEILLQRDNIGVESLVQKYVTECQLMSDLRHPHLVQFMGVCFLPDSSLPVLLMERLLMSLDDLLENTPDIPLALKRSILADVAKGLVYLHNRSSPIIHRDLSAKNVLLNSAMVAKISDLGNSRIVDFQLARTLSTIPGTLVYMPPEAFDDTSRYGTRLDVFSFGHLALFTITQVYPRDLKPHTYPDPNDPDNLIARTEVERRENYIDQLHQHLGERHPLVQMIKQCLHNVPLRRPSTEEVLEQLERMRDQIQDPYNHMTKLEMMMALKQRDSQLQQLQGSIDDSTQEREQLQMQMQQLQLETGRTVDLLRSQIQDKEIQLHQKETQMNTVQQEFRDMQAQLQAQLSAKDKVLATTQEESRNLQSQLEAVVSHNEELLVAVRADLEASEAQLREKEREAQHLQSGIRALEEELRTLQSHLDGELAAREHLLATARADLEAREVQLRGKEREVQQKDAENSSLQGELRNLRSQLERAQAQSPSELTLPVRIKWKRCKDMLHKMHNLQAVVVRDKVCVGGGCGEEEYIVMVYDPKSDQWNQLSAPYWFKWFGMVAMNAQLVLVGGKDDSGKNTSRLGVWDDSHRWTEPYPHMKNACVHPSVVTHEKWLVVAGGIDDAINVSGGVEILDTTNRQWYLAASLPRRCGWMKSALVRDTLYLLGGRGGGGVPVKEVFTVSLSALIRQATIPFEAAATHTLWQTLPATPLGHSAVLVLRGSLLAIGGEDDKKKPSTAIYLYQPSTKKWVKVQGGLPTPRRESVCILLPSQEFVVLGGRVGQLLSAQVDSAIVP